jgi:hypothetical protein
LEGGWLWVVAGEGEDRFGFASFPVKE